MKLLMFFLMMCQICFAQVKKHSNIDAMVNYVISKNMDREAIMKTPEGMVYFFTVSLVFDDKGFVDTGFYSKNIDKKVKEVMNLTPSLIRKIKEQNVVYKTYASKIVVVPLFFFRRTDSGINYDTGFIKSIANLLPDDNPKFKGKSWVILDPTLNPFVELH